MERTVFPCKEFEPVDVPIELLSREGKVDVYPELNKYFDVDYRSGRLVLVAKSYVGLIPVNDRVAIHVVPRFPISNLFYILQRADTRLKFVTGFPRSYDLSGRTDLDPASLFGHQLLGMLSHVRKEGLLRRYETRTHDDRIDGNLLLSDTVSRYFSSGIRHRQVRRITELTSNIVENRLVRSAVHKLAMFYSTSRKSEDGRQAKAAAEALAIYFDGVSPFTGHKLSIRQALPRYIARLPAAHKPYGALLWIAYLIEARQGLAVDRMGPVSFDTFVVNLADVFESYIRQVITTNIQTLRPGYQVRNGNINHVALFAQGQPVWVKPDIYLVSRGNPTVVLDAKYKPSVKPADRYEILAFCEALSAKVAIALMPSVGGTNIELLGRTQGGIDMHAVRIDLGAEDMVVAETEFIKNLGQVLRGDEDI